MPKAFASRHPITTLCLAFRALRFSWLTIIVVGGFAGLIAGCATVPKATPAAREQALGFRPPPGDSGVYIICPYYFLGGQAYWDFCLDRQKPTSLKTSSFIYTPVWPGEHTISATDSGNSSSSTFFANEGQNYFIAVGPSVSGKEFKMISAEAGEKDVRQYEMSGDSFYQFPFMPETVDSAAPAACHILLPQDDPFVAPAINLTGLEGGPAGSYIPPNATPVQVGEQAAADAVAVILEGVVDSIFNGAANSYAAAKATRMSQVLQGHGTGESFMANFQSALARTAARSPWFHAGSIDLTRESADVPVSGNYEHPVLQIKLVYGLTPHASSLFMRADLLYFRQGETNAIYHGLYSYLSEALPGEDKKAIAQWTASNAMLLCQRMGEGTSELISMMDIDFFHRVRIDPSVRTVLVSSIDPFEGRRVTDRGFLLCNEGHRLIFQDRAGNLFSVVGQIVSPSRPPENAIGTQIDDIYVKPVEEQNNE